MFTAALLVITKSWKQPNAQERRKDHKVYQQY